MKYLIQKISICLILLGLIPWSSIAQDIQPRVYAPAPIGTNVFSLAYTYSFGSVLFDKTIPVANTEARINAFNAAYSRAVNFFGTTSRFDLVLPIVSGYWEGEILNATENTYRFGVADPVIRYAIFFKGAPALTKREFAKFKPKTIIGFSVRVQIPLGQYDPERIINLGTNRWSFSPQLGLWHGFNQFTFEAYASLWLFTKNHDFLGSTRTQNPLATIQLHFSYAFKNGIWIAASTRQSFGGGVTTGEGTELDPETNNRVGLSLAIPLSPKYNIRLSGTTGLSTTIGNDYTNLGIGIQALF